MFLRVLLVSGLLLVASTSFAAEAREGAYVGVYLGGSIPNDLKVNDSGYDVTLSRDTGFAVGSTAGYDFGHVRLEGELGYKTNDLTHFDGDSSSLGTMLNLYYDFHNNTRVTPYVGAGLGFSSIHLTDFGSKVVFAYQAGAGIEIELNRALSVDLGYRYFGTTKASKYNVTGYDNSSHNLIAGLRFNF